MRLFGPVLALASVAMALMGCHLLLSGPVPLKPLRPSDVHYPFGGRDFQKFVDRSFALEKAGESKQFFDAFNAEMQKARGHSWLELLALHQGSVGVPAQERPFAEDLWKGIKQTIRKFSLDRGFEFSNVVRTGERQCFLQSVVIAGLAQKGGLDAGVAMVWKNPQGQTSNLGHATAIVRLSDGRDLIIDASDPVPTVKHQGLFLYSVPDRGYQFLTPVYNDDMTIRAYAKADGTQLKPSDTSFLDRRYLVSQFDYYRGERAVGGLLAKPATEEGMRQSIERLQAAVKENPGNPLAVYMLGTAHARVGNRQEANQWFDKAKKLYQRYGWMPETVSQAKA